jgi:hypothetical protein
MNVANVQDTWGDVTFPTNTLIGVATGSTTGGQVADARFKDRKYSEPERLASFKRGETDSLRLARGALAELRLRKLSRH